MKYIYHGTTHTDLEVIKPFKRFTPGGPDLADQIPPRVYATYNQAYAVAHSFPWSSDDGVDIIIKNEIIILVLPKEKVAILDQPICIYTLPDNSFTHTAEEETNLTYHSESYVIPIKCKCFTSVTEAMAVYGGVIELI